MQGELYTIDDSAIFYLAGRGHITAKICGDLRNQVFDAIDRENPIKRVLVYLENCQYMDSTFIGLLVGINKRLLKLANTRLEIVRPSKEVLEILDKLSVLALVDVLTDAPTFPAHAQPLQINQGIGPEDVLTSHEALMELSPDNQERFRGLHDILIKREKSN